MIAVRVPVDVWGDADGEALLDHWLVSEGARVRAGQPLAEAVIVKSNVDVVAPADGEVSAILVPDQGTFARGQELARIKEIPAVQRCSRPSWSRMLGASAHARVTVGYPHGSGLGRDWYAVNSAYAP